MRNDLSHSQPTTLASLRRWLLGVLAFGLAGTTADLLLISHYEDSWQLIPLATIACAFVAVAALAMTTSAPGLARVLPLFRVVMGLMVLVGVTGSVLHYRANMEFKLEMDPTLSGFALFSSVVRAKTPPAMAPGTFVLLGLLGLVLVYRRADDAISARRLSQE